MTNADVATSPPGDAGGHNDTHHQTYTEADGGNSGCERPASTAGAPHASLPVRLAAPPPEAEDAQETAADRFRRVMTEELPDGFAYFSDCGLIHYPQRKTYVPLCGPIRVVALLRDVDDGTWWRQIEVLDYSGGIRRKPPVRAACRGLAF